jgi:putative photosynthetic complex assembly protein
MLEHDYEPSPGLPQPLPGDETLLWQGKPRFESLAMGTFHIRGLAVYFAILIVARVAFVMGDGLTMAAAVAGSLNLVILAAVALGLLAGYSRMLARSTLFTITNKRVIIRGGIAVPVTMNLPFSCIERVDLRTRSDGSGEVAIVTLPNSRPSYVLLWPFVKPFSLFRVQPVLRGVPNAASAAELLAAAIGANAANATVRSTEDDAETQSDTLNDVPRPVDGRRWYAYPTLPLAAASALVVISLIVVGASRIAGVDRPTADATPVVSAVELFFEDRDDGAVVVIDASDLEVLEVIEPGADNFIRGTLRSLARARRAVDAANESPVVLRQTATGKLLLSDPVSGREIDLWAFGVTNARAFGRFLPRQQDQAASNDQAQPALEASIAAAAMNKQESKQ